MSRTGDTSATAGLDARWPIRAFRVARLLQGGAISRTELAKLASAFTQKSLVEDLLCAMENDQIVISATSEHLTRGERMSALKNGLAEPEPARLALSAKGRRFLRDHRQALEAGTCPCVWCVELAEIRAWAATPGEVERARADLLERIG